MPAGPPPRSAEQRHGAPHAPLIYPMFPNKLRLSAVGCYADTRLTCGLAEASGVVRAWSI
jgi:hypothetical protein